MVALLQAVASVLPIEIMSPNGQSCDSKADVGNPLSDMNSMPSLSFIGRKITQKYKSANIESDV